MAHVVPVLVALTALVASLLVGLAVTPAASAAPTTYSIWPSAAVPANQDENEARSVEIGVKFTSSSDGWVNAIRYFKGSQNNGQHRGSLWGPDGARLAQIAFTNETASGWQQASLTSPIKVKAGSTYTASYRSPSGRYSDDINGLSQSRQQRTYALTATAGVYTYGDGMPTSTWKDSNYYVDIVFTTVPPSGAPVTATSTSPRPSTTTTAPTTKPVPTTTATSTPTSTTPPGSATRPGPSNTGVPARTILTPYNGPKVITTAGTVIDSKDVNGSLIIRAKNVVIRNSKIHDDMSATAGIAIQDGGSATITDSEIYNFQIAITYANWTAIRVNIHDISFDGMKASSNVRLQDSWVHSAKPSSDAHWDGVQVQNGVTNTVISGNYIDASGSNTNSALFLCPDLGPSTNGPLQVTGNWLNGGNYTVSILDGANGKYFISNIAVTNNRFGHAGRYGPTYINVPVTWIGNVWDDNGTPVGK